MKHFRTALTLLLLIIILEFGINQADVWKVRFNSTIEKNLFYSAVDSGVKKEAGNSNSIESDSVFIFPMNQTYVSSLRISIVSADTVESINIRCVSENQTELYFSATLYNGKARVNIDQVVDTIYLEGITTGQGVRIQKIDLTANSSAFHISISRIIAILLIYLCGAALIKIQKMPDYSAYIGKTKESKQQEKQESFAG